MTEPDGKQEREPGSFWQRRRPGSRYLLSALCVVGGSILAVRYSGGTGDSTLVFVSALIVIILGLVSVPVFWWMDKRRL